MAHRPTHIQAADTAHIKTARADASNKQQQRATMKHEAHSLAKAHTVKEAQAGIILISCYRTTLLYRVKGRFGKNEIEDFHSTHIFDTVDPFKGFCPLQPF